MGTLEGSRARLEPSGVPREGTTPGSAGLQPGSRLVHGTLIALAFRRALPWPLALVLIALFGSFACSSRESLAPALGPEELLRASLRLDAWSLFFALAVPAVVWNASQLGTSARVEWLAPTPARRAAATLSSFLGIALAALAVTLLAGLAAEVRVAPSPQAWRRERVFATPAGLLLADRPRVRWEEPALAGAAREGARLRLWTTVAPGSGPAVTALLSCTTPAGRAEVEARVSGRAPLELALPIGAASASSTTGARCELELARSAEGAVLVLPARALELLVPACSERAVSLALAARAQCLLLSACALALGLSCWLRPALSALSVAALVLAPLAPALRGTFPPSAELALAWSEIGSGLVPALVPWSSLAGTGVLVALGLGLHALGWRATRRSA